MSENDQINFEYTTIYGKTIKLNPISTRILEMLATKWNPPRVPTYIIQNAAGDILEYPMDEEIAKSKDATAEERQRWLDYIRDLNKANANYSALVLSTYARFGTNWKDFELPKDTEWLDMQKEFGVNVPDDPKELKLHYFTTMILACNKDVESVLAQIRSLSYSGHLMPVEEAERYFRSTVESRREETAKRADGGSVGASEGSTS